MTKEKMKELAYIGAIKTWIYEAKMIIDSLEEGYPILPEYKLKRIINATKVLEETASIYQKTEEDE